MEFRVYAAFGYVTKVVNNGRVNAELHATGCRALARYAVSQNFILRNVDASNDFRIIVALPIANRRYSRVQLCATFLNESKIRRRKTAEVGKHHAHVAGINPEPGSKS